MKTVLFYTVYVVSPKELDDEASASGYAVRALDCWGAPVQFADALEETETISDWLPDRARMDLRGRGCGARRGNPESLNRWTAWSCEESRRNRSRRAGGDPPATRIQFVRMVACFVSESLLA